MTAAAAERARVRTPLLAVSAFAWVMLAATSSAFATSGAHAAGAMDAPARHAPGAHGLGRFALAWGLMLAASMLPLLAAPVRHVRARTLSRRRARAVSLFLGGYGVVWMATGLAALVASWAVMHAWWRIAIAAGQLSSAWRAGLSQPGPAATATAMLVAVVWQCSAAKQRCLNRSHAHPTLAAFGDSADRDALRFGLSHGAWCVGSCWALMLLPVLAPRSHTVAMAAVAMWVAAERHDNPAPPRWGLRYPVRATRLAVAWARSGLTRLRLGANRFVRHGPA